MPTNLADTALFYQLELLYNTTGASDSNVDLREAWAGLQGGWGSMRSGRVTVLASVINPSGNLPKLSSLRQAQGTGDGFVSKEQGLLELRESSWKSSFQTDRHDESMTYDEFRHST